MERKRRAASRFGEAVQNARTAKQLSLRALARQAEISATYLSKLERGDFPAPQDGKIYKIAEALDIDADELFALAGRVARDVQDAILSHPREMAALVLAAVDLPVIEIERLTRDAEKRKPKRRNK